MSKELNLNNQYRVLLTEVLPYELPLMLDNEGFYKNMLNKDLLNIFKEALRDNLKDWTIPFNYSIRKYASDKSRKLSLIHPYTQLQCVDFYKEHDYYMLSLCNNSPFSIRHIANRAKCIFKVEEMENIAESNLQNRIEVLDDEIEKYYRSYFTYERYDMMYKFFNSGDYIRLEQKYTNMMKMDIASCFYHIYTHTIAWAIKGKEQAKNLVGNSTFEKEFDSLMQHTNYNETNGIVVGPEISRIFAEIILQRIDINVLNRLKLTPYNLKLGKDYEVRRYVDDHYIYANSDENLQRILNVYREELEFYKLFVNEEKLEYYKRPFINNITDAKREINGLISKIAERWLEKDEEGTYKHVLKNEMKALLSIINDFRSITYKYNQNYGNLNRYFLALLNSQIDREIKNESSKEASVGLLTMYVEVSFYVFSLDMNASASVKMSHILYHLHKWAENCKDKTILPELENRIYREVKRCLDIFEVNRKDNETNIEVLNLLLSLSRTMKTPLQHTQLKRLFNITNGSKEEYEHLNYFQICTLLYIINGESSLEDIRKRIVEEINRRLLKDNALWYADNAMLFFDVVVCPIINKNEVKDIIKKVFKCNKDSAYGVKYKKIRGTKRWFFNWDKDCDLSKLISKKEYHPPYE